MGPSRSVGAIQCSIVRDSCWPFKGVVIGAGMAGLTAARRIADAGHVVTVLDKGRRAAGRMATRALAGGAGLSSTVDKQRVPHQPCPVVTGCRCVSQGAVGVESPVLDNQWHLIGSAGQVKRLLGVGDRVELWGRSKIANSFAAVSGCAGQAGLDRRG